MRRLQAQLLVAHEENGELGRLQEDHGLLERVWSDDLTAAKRVLAAECQRRGLVEMKVEELAARPFSAAPPLGSEGGAALKA